MRTPPHALALLVLLVACARAHQTADGSTPRPTLAGNIVAQSFAAAGAVGDTVWVIANSVRADRRAQFQRFIETFYRLGSDLGSRQDSSVLRTFRRTRVLYPTQQNPDSTYTYLFIMDPRISGADYDMSKLLRRVLPTDSADALLKMFQESLARDQEAWLSVQALPHP